MSSKKKIMLLKDVYKLGRSGDVSVVARGYGNYLIWKGDAVIADKLALSKQAKLKAERALKAAQDIELSKELAEKLASITIRIPVKVDQDGNMYGSVQVHDITDLLEKENIHIDKKRILMKPIKVTGEYNIKVNLYEDLQGAFDLEVVAESSLDMSSVVYKDK